VVFVVGKTKQEFAAHKLVVASASPVLESMVFEDPDPAFATSTPPAFPLRVVLPHMTPDTWELVMEMIYTDNVPVGTANVEALVDVATRYQIEKLALACRDFMEQAVTVDTALEMFCAAPKLLNESMFGVKFIEEHAEDIFCEDQEFVEKLPLERFETLLGLDKLAADEVTLFLAVDRWASAECLRQDKKATTKNRASVAESLVLLIRFPIMDMDAVSSVVKSSGLVQAGDLVQIYQYINASSDYQRGKIKKLRFNVKEREGSIVPRESKLLKKACYRKHLKKLFGKEYFRMRLTLLYKGSRDGFNAAKFHALCDNKGPTLTAIQPNATQHLVIGGCTRNSWTRSTNYSPSAKNFLWQNTETSKKLYKLETSQTSNHCYNGANYGPTFGSGYVSILCFLFCCYSLLCSHLLFTLYSNF
jgi:hypothetical protein